jgi:hypothetical protein
MAPLKFLFLAATASCAAAFAPTSLAGPKASVTQLPESFGLGLGEDTYENQPDLLKGEQEYKQYVNRISEENMLNRKVRVLPDAKKGYLPKNNSRPKTQHSHRRFLAFIIYFSNFSVVQRHSSSSRVGSSSGNH